VATRTDPSAEPRTPLSRARVLRAAVDLADKGGVEALSMRKLGHEVGVEAMSLYRHVRNKHDIVDGMVDVVFGEIGLPPRGAGWKTAMRQRAISAREVLARHP
jgi:AcrR family transcriptional regulator